MIFWLDAQLPPAIAPWIAATFGIATKAVRELGLREAKDREIFDAARPVNAVIVTKDDDFVELVQRLGAPPQILWLTCGIRPMRDFEKSSRRNSRGLSRCLKVVSRLWKSATRRKRTSI